MDPITAKLIATNRMIRLYQQQQARPQQPAPPTQERSPSRVAFDLAVYYVAGLRQNPEGPRRTQIAMDKSEAVMVGFPGPSKMAELYGQVAIVSQVHPHFPERPMIEAMFRMASPTSTAAIDTLLNSDEWKNALGEASAFDSHDKTTKAFTKAGRLLERAIPGFSAATDPRAMSARDFDAVLQLQAQVTGHRGTTPDEPFTIAAAHFGRMQETRAPSRDNVTLDPDDLKRAVLNGQVEVLELISERRGDVMNLGDPPNVQRVERLWNRLVQEPQRLQALGVTERPQPVDLGSFGHNPGSRGSA